MPTMIETKELSKMYGAFKAVDNLSIHVKKGEIYGFLGLNGAGKTTTIRMLLGMIKPSGGKVSLLGKNISPNNNAFANKIGYLVETPYSYPELTVRENLEIISRLRLLEDRKVVDHTIKLLHLERYELIRAKNLSLGNAQRLGLAKALIHKPDMLILDEPTNGLDPAGIVEIRNLLIDLSKNSGVTVFISSHILGEIAKIANRIGIIHQGKMVNEATSEELVLLRKRSLQISTNNNASASKILDSMGINHQVMDGSCININQNHQSVSPESISAKLFSKGLQLSLLQPIEEDMEHFFLRTIKENGGTL